MASKNGGGRSVDDEFPDDEPVDEIDDAEDEDVDDSTTTSTTTTPTRRRRGRPGGEAPATRPSVRRRAPRRRPAARCPHPRRPDSRKDADLRRGLSPGSSFIREVVAELRKVIWPSRKELLTYTSVVIVFVVIMMSIVALLDYGFAWVFWSSALDHAVMTRPSEPEQGRSNTCPSTTRPTTTDRSPEDAGRRCGRRTHGRRDAGRRGEESDPVADLRAAAALRAG